MAKGHRLTSRALRNGERESSHRQKRTTTTTVVLQVCAVRGLGTQPVGRMIRIIRGSQSNNSARASALHHGSCLVHTRNHSEHLGSRNKARGDTKMHSFPCVTTPPLHFQLQLKLSQSSFQSQKVGKSSGGRQENFQQKVLLFYVSTYLPIDRSAQQWKKRKGASPRASINMK